MREEYVDINNPTNYTLGSVVVSARVSGGMAVSGIEEVVTLTFVKNQVVSRFMNYIPMKSVSPLHTYIDAYTYTRTFSHSIPPFPFPSLPKAQENGSAFFCVFWDQSIDEEYGGWSTEGCRLLQEEEQMAVCTCNHLTSFALLVVSALTD